MSRSRSFSLTRPAAFSAAGHGILCLTFALGYPVGTAWAQAPAPAASVPGSAPSATPELNKASAQEWRTIAVPKNYALGPGDVLAVSVERMPQYSYTAVPVAPDGKISLPVFGQFSVVNWRVDQVQKELRKRISTRIRRPELLTVALVRPRAKATYSAYVLGEGVRQQGPVQIQLNYRLTEVLARAGGQVGPPDELIVTLARGGNKVPVTVDLKAALTDPSGSANVRILPNDVLTLRPVPVRTIKLDGDIGRPGTYVLRRSPTPGTSELPISPTLRDAIIAAGGLKAAVGRATPTTPENGDNLEVVNVSNEAIPPRFHGYILRGKQRIDLSISDVMDYSDRKANVPLQVNDYVRIDAIQPTRIYIEGNVARRGVLQLPPEAGVIEAIAQAGGLTLAPNKVLATVRRKGQVINVDLNKALLNNDTQSNVRVEQNDILIIGEEPVINVVMAGEFNRPEGLRLKPGTSLSDAVAQAGGIKVAPTDARMSVLRTINGRPVVLTIDPAGLFLNNDMRQNVVLQDADVVTVTPIKRPTVFVSGEVAQTGPQTIKDTESLADVLARAGGTKPRAALTQIIVERNGTRYTVDAYDAIREGGTVNFELQDGDYIVVPAIQKNIMVMEAVAKPDVYPLPEKGSMTVLAALSAAGGATPDANTKDIIILRPTENGAKVQSFVFSLKDIKKGNWEANTPLQPGDMVYVSRKEVNRNTLGQISRYATQALTLFRLGNIF